MADNIDWGAIYDAQVGAQSPPAPSPTGPDWGAVYDAHIAQQPSWENELSAVKNRFLEGASGIADLGVTGLSKVAQGMLTLTGNGTVYDQYKDYFPQLGDTARNAEEGLRNIGFLGKEKAQTAPGRIAGEVASFLPGLPLGGGVPSLVSAGVASGLTKEVTDNPYAALVASLVGGAVPSVANTIKNAAVDAGSGLIPQNIAAIKIQDAAGNPEQVAAQIEGYLAKNAADPFLPGKTTAEITKNTGLAQLEKSTAKTGGNAILGMVGDQLEKRDALRNAALGSLASDEVAGLSKYEAGNAVRDQFYVPANKAARKEVTNAFNDVFDQTQGATLPIGGAKESLAQSRGQFNPDMAIMEKGQEVLAPSGEFSGKLAALADKIENAAPRQSLEVMQKLRSKAGNIAREAARSGDGETASIANSLKSAFTNIEKKAASGAGELTQEQADLLSTARELHAKRISAFGSGSSKRILATTPEGDFRMPGENVVPEILRSPSNALKFAEAVGTSPKAKELVRGQIRQQLESMTPNAQKNYILSHQEQFKSIMQPRHLKVVKQMAQDIADEQFIGRATQRAGRGGSDTAPNLASYMQTMMLTKLPIVKQVTAVSAHLGINPTELANRAIMKAALDPKQAVKLLRAPTRKMATDVLSEYISEVGRGIKSSALQAAVVKGPDTLRKDIERSYNQVNSPPPAAAKSSYQTIAEQLRDKVIKQESGGKPDVISSAGAKGLMQLMDKTGREMHAKLKISSPYDPFNPEQNKQLGTAYLAEQLKSFDGDPILALAAYNAGPGRLRDAIEKAGTTKWVKLKKVLPAETRQYVQAILGDQLNG